MSVQGIAMATITRGILYGKNVIPMIHAHLAERMFCQTPDQPESDLKSPNKTVADRYNEFMNKKEEELRNALPYEKMPKLPMVPLFGSAWLYFPLIGKYSSSDMYETDLKKKNTYGDIVRERFGKLEIVSSYDPSAWKVLFANEGIYPARAEFLTLKTYREKRKFWYDVVGLVAMQGPEWHDFRNKVQKHVHVYFPKGHQMVFDVAKDAMKLIEIKKDSHNEIQDLISLVKKWALESVVAISLDTRLNCLDPNIDPESDGMKMIQSVQTQLECINKLEPSSGNFPFWRYFPTPTWLKFVKAADVFTGLVFNYVKNSMKVSSNNAGAGKKDETLLQNMLMDESLQVSATMVAVADIIMAGIDTTSHAVAYFLFCLAKNPEKQEKLYQEIMKAFPNKEKMVAYNPPEYYRMCFDETMRLYPVVRGNLRIFDRDVVIQKYKVPAGVAVLSVHHIYGRDPRYFDKPNEFIPERFEKPPKARILYFGIGSRHCLGQMIATREIFAVIVEVLRNYRVESRDDDIKLVTRLVNVPDRPIRMKFIKR